MASNAYPKNRKEIETKFGTILIEELGNKIIRFMIGDFSDSKCRSTRSPTNQNSWDFPGAFITAYEGGDKSQQ
jgi:hypothetical protein